MGGLWPHGEPTTRTQLIADLTYKVDADYLGRRKDRCFYMLFNIQRTSPLVRSGSSVQASVIFLRFNS